ncbi:MAG: zf-HC2 domain-containing protein [Planctomycetes bacterium]|nr:zf-HC2 domain-containing protein [Planctomycetota bacterium]
MGCEEARDMLALYVGGEAADNDRIAVEAHLTTCADCRKELDKYRETRGLLAELREGAAPEGTFERVWQRVRDEVMPHRGRVPVADWVVRVAAVLMFGAGIGFIASMTPARAPAAPEAVATHDEAQPSTARGEAPVPAVGGDRPYRVDAAPRWFPQGRPSVRLDGNYYLPHVEAILGADEVDF